MYDPMKPNPNFGAELRKRQTPELARKTRRAAIRTWAFGIAMGLALCAAGVHGTSTGEIFRGTHSSLPLNGWELAALGLVVAVASGWGLVRQLRDK